MSGNTTDKSVDNSFPSKNPSGLITSKEFIELKDNPDATKELDPSRFLSFDKEGHIVYLKGGLIIEVGEDMKIKLADQQAKREDDVPLYVIRRLMFGQFDADDVDPLSGDNWLQLCKNTGKLYRMFRLDTWVYDKSDTGMLKLRLTAYDPAKVLEEANEAKMSFSIAYVRNLLSRNFKAFRKTRAAEYDTMESDRIDLIGFIRTLPYAKVVKHNLLNESDEPVKRVAEMASGFFRCTADEASALAVSR